MERRCFIHAGTHKTGTTSLQDMLARNAPAFARANVAIVRAGRPVALANSEFVGNQNLAWQLVDDPRFDPRAGTLADFTAELGSTPHHIAIVTSEDFSLAFDRPGALEALREAVTDAGFRPIVVMYLRDQAGYAQSLYSMFVRRGKLPLDFEDFTAQIFRDARVGWATFRFPFEYDRLLAPFTAAFGDDGVVVRAYAASWDNGALLHDFFDGLGIGAATAAIDAVDTPRLNEGSSLLDVMNALHANYATTRGELISPAAIAQANAIPLAALRGRYAPVDAPLAEHFEARFRASNAIVFERFGVRIVQRAAMPAEDAPVVRAFLAACRNAWRAEATR